MVNCVRDSLVQKILARPAEMVCCGEDPRYFNFIHEEKGCKGILYLGILQKKEIVVCSECRLVQSLKDVIWNCSNCGTKFFCKKTKNSKDKSKNCYMIKPKSLMKIDTAGLIKGKKSFNNEIKNEKYPEKKNNLENFRKSENKAIKLERAITIDNLFKNKKKLDKNENKIIAKIVKNLKNEDNYQGKEENISNKKKPQNEQSDEDLEKNKQIKTKKIASSFYKKHKNYATDDNFIIKEEKIEKEKKK